MYGVKVKSRQREGNNQKIKVNYRHPKDVLRYSDGALVLGYFPPLVVPYLAQGDLQLAQEVVVAQVDGFVVDVVNAEYQLLHHFEIVVDDKLLGKLGVEAILDLLRARHLLGKKKINTPYFFIS